MLDQLWNSWGASVIGPLHVKAGIPNQDSWMARRYKWGNVVVVSDGLGSKAHSDHGSKAACLAVFEAAKSYPFVIDDFTRTRLLEGMDDIGSTLRDDELISAFEATRPSYKPVTK